MMPIYEYRCEEHGDFSYQRSIQDRNEELNCPDCGSITERIISAPSLSLMNNTNRKAWARNEKSAHEPIRKKKHVCSHSCNHDHGSSHTKKTEFMQASTKSRPWMLGH